MKLSTGRWVSGDDFFDREDELKLLESLVCDGNHVLLTGQRRMGKTSVARELGRRLQDKGWVFLFTDVEGATFPEDVIARIAEAAHPVRPISSAFAAAMKRWFTENVDEISAIEFRVKIRAGLSPGTWQQHGKQLFDDCAAHDHPVFLVIDELPIFLKQLLREKEGDRRADEFLSWLRYVRQSLESRSPVFLVSGSIGLAPLATRLGIPDRINDLHDFRLKPWSRKASVECFELLAASCGLPIDDDVAAAVYEALGIGIPHHVQSFFAHLRKFATMQGRDRVTAEDVGRVYRTELLGPSGQNDLVHYETRLKEGMDDECYGMAMEILAEAAIRDVFTASARHCLEQLYSQVMIDAPGRITEALAVLEHDGYLETHIDGHHIPFRLLKDWWAARFRDHHTPLESRLSDQGRSGIDLIGFRGQNSDPNQGGLR